MINVFLSRPNWVPRAIDRHINNFYTLLDELNFNPRTVGKDVVPLSSPFETVVDLMDDCQCTIVLGLPQLRVSEGTQKGEKINRGFHLASEWNQIEAAISIMLNMPTLMMLHKSVAAIGLFGTECG